MISTPSNFVLPEPIDNSSAPSPKPPTYMKHQVYDDPNVFEKVDYHAIRVARNTYPTFRDLLWDLVFRYKLNELEKARVIFRWMTSCDMSGLTFQTSQKGSPEESLLSLKNLKGSYANALELMCSYAGLYCLTISGYAKGVDYRPGDIFKEQAFNHSWNVIFIQESWQLIDAHWATRYLTARKNTQDSIVYQYDDFYFIMEPQQAVYSHFPQDPVWQLLKEPLTINQFENLPLTKSQFFKCGMDFHNQHHGVVHSKDGNLKMTLGFWKPDSFTYKLVTDNNSDNFNGVSLKYFVIQETVNNQIHFYFRFPAPGNYYLTIFVQELNEHNLPVNQENVFRAACEYKIVADKAAQNSLPYPMSCHDLNWGPQWSLISHYNLTPVQEDGVISIKSPDNKPFVRTEIKFDKMRDDVGLFCKLRKNNVEDEDVLDQYIEIVEKPDRTTFFINLPEPGEYGLEIYANEPSEGDTFTHVCQYLLDFEPPPGYKPQSSVFGPIKAGSTSLTHKPSNIREMYNYEKDASPMGALPKPYLVSQFAPEDATMIPGQTKNKPKPFAYNQTEKSDESDMEMPDFLPPPPPPSLSTESQFDYNKSPNTAVSDVHGANMNKNNAKFPQPPSLDDSLKQFNTTGRPLVGQTNQYGPDSQRMTSGDSYTAIQGAKPFAKSYAGDGSQIKIGDSAYHPGQKSHHSDDKSRTSDDELIEQTARLQPYMASVEMGQSPQLSRKVYEFPNKSKTADPKETGAKFGVNLRETPKTGSESRTSRQSSYSSFEKREQLSSFDPKVSNRSSLSSTDKSERIKSSYELKSFSHSSYSSIDRKERLDLSDLNIVSSAFGKDDSLSSKQPYLENLGAGHSPSLSRKYAQILVTQGQPQTGSSNIPETLATNSDTKKPAAFRGYGRPNFSAGQNEVSNSNFPPPPPQSVIINEQKGTNYQPGQKQTNQFKDDKAKVQGPTHVTGTYGVRNPSDPDKSSNSQNWPRNSPFKDESASVTARMRPAQIDGDSRKDSNKISNIAMTLSPAGFKKTNQPESSSDQYNNQYEDKSKIMPSPIQKYRPDDSTANWTSGSVQKEPPKNFQPTPVQVVEEVYKPDIITLPSEAPTSTTLSPEETSKIFQRIDDHAMQVSAEHQDSFNQLIWQLIYARNITDELEKVRVIFLWLCTKDLHKMNFDDIKKDSPEEILMGLKTGRSTYAQIFLILCSYAGLHSKLIVGYAKGADYVPGMKFQGRHGEHSWNGVQINGVWRLVDCHWAARRLIGKERKPENVRYELDMFYFLANPSQLIYTHFPHEQVWQLLHHPVNIEEFESLAPVKSMFFKYNLDLVTHKNAVINNSGPEFELRIAFPKGVEERLMFTFSLTFNDGTDQHNGEPLARYGRQEIDYVNNHSSFWIRAPIPGSYKLLLYTKLISAENSGPDSGSQNMFGAICEYKVEFDFQARQALLPFPGCQTSTYGPSEVYKRYPIEACVTKSSIITDNGTVEIKFLIKKSDTRVMAKLISSSGRNNDELTEQCVLQRLVANEEALINVFLPEAGEYGLEVYANNSIKDGISFYTVWQYFIVSSSGSIVNGLPSLPMGYMGPSEPKFSTYGLSTYSHKDPFIVANTGDLSIQLKTIREKPVRIMTQLIHCSHNVNQPCPNQVLQQSRDSIIYFLVRLPHEGFFKLQIFGLPYTDLSESLPGIFNYLIEANQRSSHRLEFPQQFAQWKEGCYLHEPLDGVLGVTARPNQLWFKMEVPRAKSLAVVVDNEWTKLERDSSGEWSGAVDMSKYWGKVDQVNVCACYGGTMDDSFTTILKYSVQ